MQIGFRAFSDFKDITFLFLIKRDIIRSISVLSYNNYLPIDIFGSI